MACLLLVATPLSRGHGQEPQAADQEQRPPTVRRIQVEGAQRYTQSQLLSALGQRVGVPLDREVISSGLDTLWKTFRVKADVHQQPFEDGVELLLVVTEMPRDLEPRFIGNVEIDAEDLLQWADLEPGNELYLHQAPRVRERIINGYRSEGFYFVEVEEVVRKGGEGVAADVIFEIREGPRVHVRDVVIHGNESMPDRGMLFWKTGLRRFAELELRGPRFFFFKREFVEEKLLGDLQAMREVYRSRGWLDAVVELEKLDFNDERDRVTIHLSIDEGPRYRVGSLRIDGVELYGEYDARIEDYHDRPTELILPEEELLDQCDLEPGAYYEKRLERRDARALEKYYGERGYISHRTLPIFESWEFRRAELTFDETDPVVNVVYKIGQGTQQFIREILISGTTNTQDRIVRGRITVEPGGVADLTEIERSRNRIQGMGFFSDSRPGVEHREPTFRFLETGDPAWKDIIFEVEEVQGLSFNVSGGISSNTGLFGLVSVTKRNFDLFDLPSSPWDAIGEIADGRAFHGGGQLLRLTAAPGTERTSFIIIFQEPDLFRRHTDRIGLDLRALRSLRIFESHDEVREELGGGLRYQIGPDSILTVGYATGTVEVDDLNPGGEPTLGSPLSVPALLKDQEGDSDIARLQLTYERSDLDNFVFPQRGTTFELNVQAFDEVLGADFDFLRAQAVWEIFGQFGPESEDAQPGWKLQLSGGVALPYGATDDVPYTERFQLGGQRTLRSFDFRGVGPNENGFPIGGETMLSGSLEYRYPLITTVLPGSFRSVEVIRGGLFLDAGILDPDPFSLDPGELRAGTGILIGLTQPLPITFTFGVTLREGPQDDPRALQFNIGL